VIDLKSFRLQGSEFEKQVFGDLIGKELGVEDVVKFLRKEDVSNRYKAYLVLRTDFLDIGHQREIVDFVLNEVMDDIDGSLEAVRRLVEVGLRLLNFVGSIGEEIRLIGEFGQAIIAVDFMLEDENFVGKDRSFAYVVRSCVLPFDNVRWDLSLQEKWKRAASLSVDYLVQGETSSYGSEDDEPFMRSLGHEYEMWLGKVLMKICDSVLGISVKSEEKSVEMSLF
jgi:hypothetical protein